MRLMEAGAALLLLLNVFARCLGEELIQTYNGSSVTFTAKASAPPTEINWLKDDSRIVDVEEGNSHFYSMNDTVIVDLARKTFTIKHVIHRDAGLYKASALVDRDLEHSFFRLKVYDRVGNCTIHNIHNISDENNVTLNMSCSGGAHPTQYRWYRGSRVVSEEHNITILRGEKDIPIMCVASNEVSNKNATFIVPRKTKLEHDGRSHIITIILLVLLIVAVILALVCGYRVMMRNKVKSAKDEERQKLNQVIQGEGLTDVTRQQTTVSCVIESLTPCARVDFLLIRDAAPEIIFKKAEKVLMKVVLHLQMSLLEKLSVLQGRLKIMDVNEGDYGTYTAQVHPPIGGSDTFTFCACKSAQNGEAGAHDGLSDREPKQLVHPINGELNMTIPNANNAEKIIWRKDGKDLLTVTCGNDSLLGRLALYKGAMSMDLISEDTELYCAEVSHPDGNSTCYNFDVKVHRKGRETDLDIKRLLTSEPTRGNDAALGFGDVTLRPEDVSEGKKITWKKDNNNIAEVDAKGNAQYSTRIEASLDPMSGSLTLKNVEEKDNGQYVMEVNGDRATAQTFNVTIKLETAF